MVVYGLETARTVLGSRGWVEPEPAVHARDDEIEGHENLVKVIKRAIRQDVGFDAFEDCELLRVGGVQPIDCRVLLADLVAAQAAGLCGGTGMVRHTEIGVAVLARGFGRLPQGMGPI